MRKLVGCSFKTLVGYTLTMTLMIAFFISCRKTDQADTSPVPVISYKQKNISIAEDVAMTPVKPDSTGGPITEYTVSPFLPKGLTLNKANGEISGTPSDTLMPTRYIVRANGPGGTGADTITLSVGTVAFNYGANASFVLEKGTVLSTPISPTVLAGTFTQYLISSPYPDSLYFKTAGPSGGGLTFSPSTGQISGSVTKLTSTTEVPVPAVFTITGISSTGKTATATISITVNDKKPNFSYPSSGSTFSVGTPVGNVLTPVNNLDPINNVTGKVVKFRASDAATLTRFGLSLDSTTGKLTGTPTKDTTMNIVVKGLNTGGSLDVTVPIVIKANPDAPRVAYVMSWISGNLVDTLQRINSGSTVYLTKSDFIGQTTMYLTPVVIAGQPATTSTAYTTTAFTGEGMSMGDRSTGVVSGTPANGAPASSAHTITIANAATGGLPAGSFDLNIVYNAPFFTYNTTGIRGSNNNIFNFIQGQPIHAVTGDYPGYATQSAPVGGTGIVSYAIYPATATTLPFSSTGLSFNTTTGVISGTPSTNTMVNTNYTFWDYIVQGKKADGSFTVYKIRFKIFRNIADWDSTIY